MTRNRVRAYRHTAGLTLAQLSEKAGIPISTLSDIEHGIEPRVITALQLAEAFNTTVDKLWQSQNCENRIFKVNSKKVQISKSQKEKSASF